MVADDVDGPAAEMVGVVAVLAEDMTMTTDDDNDTDNVTARLWISAALLSNARVPLRMCETHVAHTMPRP